MLHGISWAQFLSFLGIGLVIYYLVVGIQFFGRSVAGKVSGKQMPERAGKGDGPGSPGGTGSSGGAGSSGGSAVSGGAVRENGTREAVSGAVRTVMPEGDGQPGLFRAEPKGQGETPELFKVMEQVIGLLKDVMTQGMALHSTREELTDRIREVLVKYGQLKRTPYQVAVNNYLVRTCGSQFSLALDEAELERLWG